MYLLDSIKLRRRPLIGAAKFVKLESTSIAKQWKGGR